ncbi:MAG: hypothetical protein KKC50_08065 [Candidatus Omnitrophica bacterium]|nr:hypothetical protein [Candidatus Omnitrophota bacterium]
MNTNPAIKLSVARTTASPGAIAQLILAIASQPATISGRAKAVRMGRKLVAAVAA